MTSAGIIGPITWARIVDENATLPNITAPRFPGNLQEGSRGENVRTLQSSLNALRPVYPSITQLNVDGIFGPITRAAVSEFQRIFGMTRSGIANQVTWNLLMSMVNLTAQPAAVTVFEETPKEEPDSASAYKDTTAIAAEIRELILNNTRMLERILDRL